MPTALITGCNRGIGLEFVRQYAADGWRVRATCRNPRAAKELAAVAGDVKIHALDVADDYQVASLAKSLADEPIDLLINNAGLGSPEADEFGKTSANDWLDVLRVNTIAPMHVVEQFIGHLEAGQRRLIVNITSKMGSIADSGGGSYIYRSSKAALNMVAKSLAQDLKGKRMIVVVFHPGWVKTDMGGPHALIPPKLSVAGMRAKISSLTFGDSGKFFNYDGQPIPW